MTNVTSHLRSSLLVCSLFGVVPVLAFAQSASDTSKTSARQSDGQHDFDFEFGAWKIHLARRLRPLTGSTTWVEYDGRIAPVAHQLVQ